MPAEPGKCQFYQKSPTSWCLRKVYYTALQVCAGHGLWLFEQAQARGQAKEPSRG